MEPCIRSCVVCTKKENLLQCSKCKRVTYCSKEHQREDWKRHKKDCRQFAQPLKNGHTHPNVLSNDQSNNISKEDSSLDAKTTQKPNIQATYSNGTSREKTDSSKTESRFGNEISLTEVQCKFPQPKTLDMKTVAVHVHQQLINRNFCVLDNIFKPEMGLKMLNEVKKLHSSGVFVPGQLGGGKVHKTEGQFTEKRIRGDIITFLDGNEPSVPLICELIKYISILVGQVSLLLKGRYTISQRTKVMVACYPGNGTGYTCHVDNPNKDGRCITCLYYLNPNWDAKIHGGLLRLFPEGASVPVDVEPIFNRILLFWSDRRCPHEVQPSYATRYAITVWYFDKKEREEAMKAQFAADYKKTKSHLEVMNIATKETSG